MELHIKFCFNYLLFFQGIVSYLNFMCFDMSQLLCCAVPKYQNLWDPMDSIQTQMKTVEPVVINVIEI